MGSQLKNRDILQDLFTGESSDEITLPAVEELTKLIERYAGITRHAPAKAKSEPPARNSRPKRARPKKKTTYYLSMDTSEALEEAKEEIRTLVSPGLKRLVSKSRIVEMALQYVLDELAKKGPESKLVEHILENQKNT